ncbi:MAG: NAD(P)H-dependent oxidoreductase [Spirochaetales bacterium]|nr:NAD(P)H-dependent oxidoreductase [Spirochaetales bacterium]MCF7938700.1 NAD(P)H-dependent oxidoreductase [Spirochaetales bacterium]
MAKQSKAGGDPAGPICIIYAHPWDGSLNRAVLAALERGIRSGGGKADVIDLYAEGFDPVMSEADLALYGEGRSTDPKVAEYQQRIDRASHIIFLFPVWWQGPPAVLKGFLDKVLLPGWSYEPGPLFPRGFLKQLSATVVVTLGAPLWYFRIRYRNPLRGAFAVGSLKFVGIRRTKLLAIGRIGDRKRSSIEAWLGRVERYGRRLPST